MSWKVLPREWLDALPYSGNFSRFYYRGLNNDQSNFEVHLRYHRPYSYKESGSRMLVIIQAPKA